MRGPSTSCIMQTGKLRSLSSFCRPCHVLHTHHATQAEEMTEEEAALLKRLSAKFAGAAMTCMFINARGKKRCFDEIDRILRVRSQEFMGSTRIINAACLLDSAATQQDFLLQNNLNHRAAYCKTLFQTIVFFFLCKGIFTSSSD